MRCVQVLCWHIAVLRNNRASKTCFLIDGDQHLGEPHYTQAGLRLPWSGFHMFNPFSTNSIFRVSFSGADQFVAFDPGDSSMFDSLWIKSRGYQEMSHQCLSFLQKTLIDISWERIICVKFIDVIAVAALESEICVDSCSSDPPLFDYFYSQRFPKKPVKIATLWSLSR